VERTFTATQAGRIIGVTNVSIWRYIQRGELAARKETRGRTWKYLVTETELRRFSNQYQTQFDLPSVPQPQ